MSNASLRQRSGHSSIDWEFYWCLLSLLAVSILIELTTRHGRNFNLPNKQHHLIGRELEMENITNYLEDVEVRGLSLFSAPGYGKSEMCVHFGHRQIEAGVDVYYINVRGLPNMKKLIEILFSISELKLAPDDNLSVQRWSEQINKPSLLILDNVDGAWVNHDVLAKFVRDFVQVLLWYSKNLKILITSWEEIKPTWFRSLHLHPPLPEHCVGMFKEFVSEISNVKYTVADQTCVVKSPACATKDKVETLCDKVGMVPKAVEVLASSLSISETIDSVLKEFADTRTFNVLTCLHNSTKPWDISLRTAFEVAFGFVPLEYQVCCLLLTKFREPFSVARTESVITRDLMTNYNNNFHIRGCLQELTRRSFMDIALYNNSNEVKIDYYFHTLTRVFLLNTNKVVVPRDILELFWDKYFEVRESWLRDDLNEEDIKEIIQFLHRGMYYSYRLAVHLTHMIEKLNIDERVIDAAINVLLDDCKKAGLTYPRSSVFIPCTVNAYYAIFTSILPHDKDYMDKLALCVAKVEQLLQNKKEHKIPFNTVVTVDFYNIITSECESINNSHEICNMKWRYNLLSLINSLMLLSSSLEDSCQKQPNCSTHQLASYTDNGLISYLMGDDIRAEQNLQSAFIMDDFSASCKEVCNVILYIALYDIFSKRDDRQSAEEILTSISQLDLQDVDLTCHLDTYMHIVIPFLNSINNTDLARALSKQIANGNCAAVSDRSKLGFAAGSANDINNKKLSQDPFASIPSILNKQSQLITPETAEKILEGKASLFCFVFKDKTPECNTTPECNDQL